MTNCMQESFDFRGNEYKFAGAVYEAITEWMIDTQGLDAKLSVLGEAYYSVNCDYLLSAYLQYPNYAQKPQEDFLKPYFELGGRLRLIAARSWFLRVKFTQTKELNANGRF